MKKIIILVLIFIGINSCNSSKEILVKKQTTYKKVVRQPKVKLKTKKAIKSSDLDINLDVYGITDSSNKAIEIIEYAKQFNGVKYKFGGTTDTGMDCSGLVFESFRAYNIILPRISRDMAKKGVEIPIKSTKEGDLLFFKTSNRRNGINHVGLVVDTVNGDIEFIHATLSTGVTISKLSESYWDSVFIKARRIL